MTEPSGSGRVFGDRYVIERKIARGGMADVFLARDRLLDRPVALKVLFPELSVDPSFVERFRREAQNAAKLSHPNVVSVYDWGEDENTYYIVMEYLDGRSLSAVLRDDGPLDAVSAGRIGEEVAAALSFAHRNGVIHRDVKPGNVLIDARGSVKVTDFGIARARNTTENLTQTGAVMGTATYFSPEQAQGLEVDQRSDVYSLGVVLYEMVAGRPPFQGDNPVTIAYKHVREDPTPLRTIVPSIPAPFESIVAQAMTKAPANRYLSAEDLRADLERFRHGQPVKATRLGSGPISNAVPARSASDPYADSTRTIPSVAPRPPVPTSPAVPHDGKGLAGPLMIFVGLLAVIGIAAAVLYSGAFDRNVTQVKVPAVVDKSLDDAKAALEDVGLGLTIDRVSSDKPENTVIAQNPAGEATVPSTQRVALTVSSGPAPTPLPDFTNQTVDTATKTLQRLGLKVATTETTSDTYEKGRVISQNPNVGETPKRDSTVTLTVSSGPQQVEVPNVVGYTVSTAAQALSDAGLRTSLSQDVDPSTLVARTDPTAGTKVSKGSTVTITPQTSTTTSTSSTSTTTSSSTTSTTKP